MIKNLFNKLRNKNKVIDCFYEPLNEKNIIKVFYNKAKYKRIIISKNEGSYSYKVDSFYFYDNEERKYINKNGYWAPTDIGVGSFFASEELVFNEIENLLEGYIEYKENK